MEERAKWMMWKITYCRQTGIRSFIYHTTILPIFWPELIHVIVFSLSPSQWFTGSKTKALSLGPTRFYPFFPPVFPVFLPRPMELPCFDWLRWREPPAAPLVFESCLVRRIQSAQGGDFSIFFALGGPGGFWALWFWTRYICTSLESKLLREREVDHFSVLGFEPRTKYS